MRIDADKEFDSIVLRDIKLDISKAFILLEANMMEFLPLKNNDEKRSLLARKKANQMKNEINHFIDAQVKMITDGSRFPIKTGCPNLESQGETQNLPP